MDDYKRRVEQAYALNRKNPRVLRAVGALLYNLGEGDKAFEFYSKAIEVDPTENFALYYRAREYRFKRKFAAAIADASALLAVSQAGLNDTQSFQHEDGIVRDFRVIALLERAYSYQDSGRLDLAEKDYDAAVECRAFGACARRTGAFPRLLRSAQGRCAARPHRGGAQGAAELQRSLFARHFTLRDSSALRRRSRPSMPL